METKNLLNKKITQWLLLVAMLVGCSASAWASTTVTKGEVITIDVSGHNWFSNDNYYPRVYIDDTPVGVASGFNSSKVYDITITSTMTGTLYLERYNGREYYNKYTMTERPDSNPSLYKVTGEWSGTWSEFTVPSEVLNGTNIMFYVEGQYDGQGRANGITDGSSNTCLGSASGINGTKSYINIAKTSIPDKMYVTNNCDNWVGDGWTNKEDVKAGKYHKYNNDYHQDATTLSTFSASSTEIEEGTASVTLTIKGSRQYSSFAGENYQLYCLIYLDGSYVGSVFVNTSDRTVELNTSDLSAGTHTVQSVLTDTKIYYLDADIDIEVKPACTTPNASNFTYTSSRDFNGSSLSADVAWNDIIGGAITTYYKVKDAGDDTYTKTAPTNAGTYTIAITSEASETVCAVTTKLPLGDYTINKIDQAGLSIAEISAKCMSDSPLQITATGGSGDGAITYAIIADGTTGEATINSSENKGTLTVTKPGVIKVQATKAESTNYNAATSNIVPITFNGVSVTQSPATAHSYEPVTLTASSSASWVLTGAGTTAYLSTNSGTSTILKATSGENSTTYTVTATAEGCDTAKQITVSTWPDKCN